MTKSFYNTATPDTFTYLEFGSVDTKRSQKNIWDLRLHQEAYDFFMAARYLKDLIVFRRLAKEAKKTSFERQLESYRKEIFTRDIYNSFSKLAALHVTSRGGRGSFVELGSTLMGCIDSMRYLQCIGNRFNRRFSTLNLQKVDFHGIDISGFLNETAQEIYPDHTIITHLDWKKFRTKVDVFFAKGVSLLYAMKSSAELLRALDHARVACFDYSLSTGKEQSQYLGTGKKVVFPTTVSMLKELRKRRGKTLLIEQSSAQLEKSKQKLRAVFYYGEEKLLRKTIAEELRLKKILCKQTRKGDLRALLFYNEKERDLQDTFVHFDAYTKKHGI